jgi:hypothetical protein
MRITLHASCSLNLLLELLNGILMKNLLKTSALALITSGIVVSNAYAVAVSKNSDSADATIAVNLITPLAVSVTKDMDFGDLIVPATGTLIYTLSTEGALTVDTGDGKVQGNNDGVTVSAITGNITGHQGQTFTCTTSSLTELSSGGGTIAFELIPDTVCDGTDSKSFTAGAANFALGGRITVPSTAVADTYSGTLTITATYD